jgi:hypothetical protein
MSSRFPTGNRDFDQAMISMGYQALGATEMLSRRQPKKINATFEQIRQAVGHDMDGWLTNEALHNTASIRIIRRLFEAGHLEYPRGKQEPVHLGLLCEALVNPEYHHRALGEEWLQSKGAVSFRSTPSILAPHASLSPVETVSKSTLPIQHQQKIARESARKEIDAGLRDQLQYLMEDGHPLPDFLRFMGRGPRQGVGRLLCARDTPLALWKLAFASSSAVEKVRPGWSRQFSAIRRDAVAAICRRATRENPSLDWKEKLDWLLDLQPKIKLENGYANPIHLLASATFAPAAERISAMRRLDRVWREQNPTPSHGEPCSTWRRVDGQGATPFMRALRAGDPMIAHAILLSDPAAAIADQRGTVLDALVEHCDPALSEKLLACLMLRCRTVLGASQIEQASSKILLVKRPSFRRQWMSQLDILKQETPMVSEETAAVLPKRSAAVRIVPGTGAELPALRNARRASYRA